MTERKNNLQKELEKMLPTLDGGVLLHCCCAPCSTSCLEYLKPRIKELSLYFYNPNIDSEEEYFRRAAELERLNDVGGYAFPLTVAPYVPQEFYDAVKGLEREREGGARCDACFRLRLAAAVKQAEKEGKKYVLTTLSVSPHKNAELLYEIGKSVSAGSGVTFLPSDFKKNNGFVRSTQICRELDIYRQNYCGCSFAKGS